MDAVWGGLKDFSLVFLPTFVVMNPLAVLPFLVPVLGAIDPSRRSRVIHVVLITGLALGLLFLGVGRGIFLVLGIDLSDFLVAGGIILLVLSLREMVSSGSEERLAPNELMAVVPIGTPLLVGPATISMLLVLVGLYDWWLVLLGFLANMAVAWVIFWQSPRIVRFLGQGGLRAFTKVAYLLLAAIAVQLIRRGVTDIVEGF